MCVCVCVCVCVRVLGFALLHVTCTSLKHLYIHVHVHARDMYIHVCTYVAMDTIRLGCVCWQMRIENTQKCTCLKCLDEIVLSLVGWK